MHLIVISLKYYIIIISESQSFVRRLLMDNQVNNTVTEPFEKLAFTLSDYENFVENGGCIYTDCFECGISRRMW